ncbi:hypothetical protein [Zunongwangia sp. H14]|uniref:hypothetical protein n=1 Tax=Zunongwangia sp. H14 TaxID=3240792 RepID=UPI003563606B
MIPDRIVEIAEASGFPLWLAVPDSCNICEVVRATGFSMEPDKKRLSIYLPESMLKLIEPHLKMKVPTSFLMASLADFESYQVKKELSEIAEVSNSLSKKINSILDPTIETTNSLGLDGSKTFDYLKDPPTASIHIFAPIFLNKLPNPERVNVYNR